MKTYSFLKLFSFGMLITLFALALAACGPGGEGSSTPPGELTYEEYLTMTASMESATPEVSPELSYDDILSQTPAAPEEGLTFEEMRRTNPPMPLDLKVKAVSEGARLEWTAAEKVTIEHDYSDTVIHYNIYRRTEGEDVAKLIDTSKQLFYVDQKAEAGKTYFYAVSAVHEGPLEGEKTDEVSIVMQ